MKHHEIAQEAESRTPESKQIVSTLKKAGYKQLGSGAEATVWMKDAGTVIKIIMPNQDSDSAVAARIFHKFYDFVSQNQQYENLPKFVKIGEEHYTKFNIGGKEYIQIAMEQLYPIDEYGIEGDIVSIFSDGASKKRKFQAVIKQLTDPYYLGDQGGSKKPLQTANYFRSLDKETLAKYQVLYQLMVVLYHTGRINKFGWDLHVGNVMKRKDGTMVITDPWFSYMVS
jgi:hypothetical protein